MALLITAGATAVLGPSPAYATPDYFVTRLIMNSDWSLWLWGTAPNVFLYDSDNFPNPDLSNYWAFTKFTVSGFGDFYEVRDVYASRCMAPATSAPAADLVMFSCGSGFPTLWRIVDQDAATRSFKLASATNGLCVESRLNVAGSHMELLGCSAGRDTWQRIKIV